MAGDPYGTVAGQVTPQDCNHIRALKNPPIYDTYRTVVAMLARDDDESCIS